MASLYELSFETIEELLVRYRKGGNDQLDVILETAERLDMKPQTAARRWRELNEHWTQLVEERGATTVAPQSESLWAWVCGFTGRPKSAPAPLLPEVKDKNVLTYVIYFDLHSAPLWGLILQSLELHRPDHAILGGDTWDFQRLSRFRKLHLTPIQQEADNYVALLELLARWGVKVHQIFGNHELRLLYSVTEKLDLDLLPFMEWNIVHNLARPYGVDFPEVSFDLKVGEAVLPNRFTANWLMQVGEDVIVCHPNVARGDPGKSILTFYEKWWTRGNQDLILPQAKLVTMGHIHQSAELDHNNVLLAEGPMAADPSVLQYQFDNQAKSTWRSPSIGYATFEMYREGERWRYVPESYRHHKLKPEYAALDVEHAHYSALDAGRAA